LVAPNVVAPVVPKPPVEAPPPPKSEFPVAGVVVAPKVVAGFAWPNRDEPPPKDEEVFAVFVWPNPPNPPVLPAVAGVEEPKRPPPAVLVVAPNAGFAAPKALLV
jgi:hypothetical protein